jgi:hypothetical protein
MCHDASLWRVPLSQSMSKQHEESAMNASSQLSFSDSFQSPQYFPALENATGKSNSIEAVKVTLSIGTSKL